MDASIRLLLDEENKSVSVANQDIINKKQAIRKSGQLLPCIVSTVTTKYNITCLTSE